MSKRARGGEEAPGQSSTAAAPASADISPKDTPEMSALAGWCDDQLREIGEMYTHEEDVNVSPLADVTAVREWADNQFSWFVDALASERSMELSEARRGILAEAWRKTAADTVRVYCMRNSFMSGSHFIHGFHYNAPTVGMCREIENASSDIYEEWVFTLGWKLAHAITDACAEVEESEAEDEPVEESSEDEGEDEDSSEEEGSEEEESGESGEERSEEEGSE